MLEECTKYVGKDGQLKDVDETFKTNLTANLNQFAASSLRTLLICYKELTEKQAKNTEHP